MDLAPPEALESHRTFHELPMPELRSDTSGVKFPPPLVFVLGFAAGYALQRLVPVTVVPTAGRGLWQGLGWGLIVLGVALMGSAVVEFRRAGTTPNPTKPTTAVVTQGPYIARSRRALGAEGRGTGRGRPRRARGHPAARVGVPPQGPGPLARHDPPPDLGRSHVFPVSRGRRARGAGPERAARVAQAVAYAADRAHPG